MPLLLQEKINQKIEQKKRCLDNGEAFKPIKLADNVIVEEMEKKFHDYFIMQKNEKRVTFVTKVLTSVQNRQSKFEKALNKELIESHQEMIIEKQEHVHPYPIKEDKYVNVQKCRRPYELQVSSKQNYFKMQRGIEFLQLFCGLFKPGENLYHVQTGIIFIL